MDTYNLAELHALQLILFQYESQKANDHDLTFHFGKYKYCCIAYLSDLIKLFNKGG